MESFLHDLSWVLPLRSDIATPVFQAFTWAGYTTFYIILLALGYWMLGKTVFARLAVLVGISALINAFLKDFWQDPRPADAFRLDHAVGESYGMPSGHAQVSLTTWGFLALSVRQTWAWIGAGIMIAGIAFSQLYLGVHDVEDILAGWAIGIVVLGAFVWFLRAHDHRWHNLHWSFQLVLLAILHGAAWFFWPGGPSEAFAICALLAGWWLAVLADKNFIAFQPRSEWWARGLSGLVGIIGLFALSAAWGKAAAAIGLGDIAAGYLRTLIIALYIGAIAPPLFQLMRLAEKKPEAAA